MTDFVSDHVGLRELAGCAELIFEFREEAQVEVNLFITGTIKRAGGGPRQAAGGIDATAIEHQFCVTIIADDFGPGVLHVVENEGNELDFALFGGALLGSGWRTLRGFGSGGTAQERRKQVAFKNKTEDQKDQDAANANVNAAGESSAAAAGAVVFYVVADSAGCPTHENLLVILAG